MTNRYLDGLSYAAIGEPSPLTRTVVSVMVTVSVTVTLT